MSVFMQAALFSGVMMAMFAIYMRFFHVEEKWFTVAVWDHSRNFKGTEQEYTIQHVLRVNSKGKRRIERTYWPLKHAELLRKHANGISEYLLLIEPWEAGMLSLDEVKESLPDMKIVPNAKLAMEKIDL
jgi:hypothetical protein